MGEWWEDFTNWYSGGGEDVSGSIDTSGEYDLGDYLGGADLSFDGGGDGDYGGYGGGGYEETPNEVFTNNSQDELNYLNESNANSTNQPKSMWDTASDFLGDKKNDTMIKLGTSLGSNIIGSYQKGKAEEKADKKLQELREYNDKVQKEKEDRADARRSGGGGSSALDTLAAKDAIDQANKAKYSASVSGLRPVGGLINSKKKLTYVGGKPVYTDVGQLAS